MSTLRHVRGLLRSGKMKRRGHTTTLPETVAVIRWAQAEPEVKRIVIGRIHGRRCALRRVVGTAFPAGVRARVLGTSGMQELWLYTDFPSRVLAALNRWREAG